MSKYVVSDFKLAVKHIKKMLYMLHKAVNMAEIWEESFVTCDHPSWYNKA